MSAREAELLLKKSANQKQAKLLAGFFKTGPGQYGEGDVFWGVMVPQTRKVAKQFGDLPLSDIKKLLRSPVHELRLCALLILVHQFETGDTATKKNLAEFYLAHTKHINNWDLVDLSAPRILGQAIYSHILENRRMNLLGWLARSKNLWERRIAIISTLAFIVKGEAGPTLKIAAILLYDEHDLIHKAVGWMLREVGKRCSRSTEEKFLKKYYRVMPRTMLRYALEHFPPAGRKKYM